MEPPLLGGNRKCLCNHLLRACVINGTHAWMHWLQVFPTTVRGSGLGLCNIFARAGGSVAPMALGLPFTPVMLGFGALSFVAGAATLLLLLETRGVPLPERMVEDALVVIDDPGGVARALAPVPGSRGSGDGGCAVAAPSLAPETLMEKDARLKAGMLWAKEQNNDVLYAKLETAYLETFA